MSDNFSLGYALGQDSGGNNNNNVFMRFLIFFLTQQMPGGGWRSHLPAPRTVRGRSPGRTASGSARDFFASLPPKFALICVFAC